MGCGNACAPSTRTRSSGSSRSIAGSAEAEVSSKKRTPPASTPISEQYCPMRRCSSGSGLTTVWSVPAAAKITVEAPQPVSSVDWPGASTRARWRRALGASADDTCRPSTLWKAGESEINRSARRSRSTSTLDQLLVQLLGLGGHRLGREGGPDPLLCAGAQRGAQLLIVPEPYECFVNRGRVACMDEQARLFVRDHLRRSSHARADDGDTGRRGLERRARKRLRPDGWNDCEPGPVVQGEKVLPRDPPAILDLRSPQACEPRLFRTADDHEPQIRRALPSECNRLEQVRDALTGRDFACVDSDISLPVRTGRKLVRGDVRKLPRGAQPDEPCVLVQSGHLLRDREDAVTAAKDRRPAAGGDVEGQHRGGVSKTLGDPVHLPVTGKAFTLQLEQAAICRDAVVVEEADGDRADAHHVADRRRDRNPGASRPEIRRGQEMQCLAVHEIGVPGGMRDRARDTQL